MKSFRYLVPFQPNHSRQSRRALDDVLYRFDTGGWFGREAFTLRQACEGVAIFGGTGSGKSSGSGRHLAEAYLRAGFGGLVLTVKPDEPQWWVTLARASGRSDDLRVIRPAAGGVPASHPFNFLEYERSTTGPGGLAGNLTSLLTTALKAMSAAGGAASESGYWQDALRQLIYHTISLLLLAGAPLTADRIAAIVRTAPTRPISVSLTGDASFDATRYDAGPARWIRDSVCARYLFQAAQNGLVDAARKSRLKATANYFLQELPGLARDTRSSILSTFTTKAELLVAPPLGELLGGGVSEEVTPDATHRGRVVVVDMPILDWHEAGRFAQMLIKTAWQRATARRNPDPDSQRPVFLWADEAQQVVTEEDYRFLQTARSAQACTVFLTQGITNYRAMMPGSNPRDGADALLAGFQTKIFHANGDSETNNWAENIFGHRLAPHLISRQADHQHGAIRLDEQMMQEPIVPARAFTTLRKGGGREGITEAYIFQTGRVWRHEILNVTKARFRQKGGST